jgi:c-di-GMP-binding flagellar brake protein YcgR
MAFQRGFFFGEKITEFRRFIRWKLEKPVSIKLKGKEDKLLCNADDISLKGIRIRMGQSFAESGNLVITIALGYELFLNNIEAFVAWSKKEGSDNVYGLNFTKIRDSDKEAISEFVRRNGLEKLNQDFCRGY